MQKEYIVRYYDQCDSDYRRIWRNNENLAMHYGYWDNTVKTHHESLLKMNEVLANIAKIKSSDKILDAGCGIGGSSIWLAKTFGCKVIGISLSKKQVDMAEQFSKAHKVEHLVKFYEDDYTSKKFPSSSFDVFWTLESSCYAEDKKQLLKEAYRVLKPNGRLVVADGFLLKEYMGAYENGLMKKWLNGWAVPNLAMPENFRDDMQNIGFKDVKFLDITKNVMPSSKRLYKYSVPAVFFGKIAELLHLRTKVQTGNIIGAYYQHKSLAKNLWCYGIFYGKK